MSKTNMRRQIFAGLINQGLSSLANFGYGLYLIRALEIGEYGLYNISFVIMLFFFGSWQGFFLVQMTVLSPDLGPPERRQFVARVLVLLFMTLGLAGLLTIGAAAGLQALIDGLASLPIVCLVAATTSGFIVKEFHVRLAFNEKAGQRAVVANLVFACTLLVAVLAYRMWGDGTMTLVAALTLYALAQWASAITGHVASALSLRGHRVADLIATFKQVFSGGKWALLNNLVFTARNQAHVIVVASSIGPEGVARVAAARLLITPAVLMIPPMSQIMLPRLSELRAQQGQAAVRVFQNKLALGLTAFSAIYAALLLTAYPYLSRTLFDEGYEGLFWITALWCAYALAHSVRASIEAGALALRLFRQITTINTASAMVALALVAAFTYAYNIQGAVAGVFIGEVIVVLGLWWVQRHSVKNSGR